MTAFQVVLTALCLLSAVWILTLIILDRTPDRLLLNGMAALSVAMIVHAVVEIIRVTHDAPAGVPVWEYIGYLLGAVLVIPAGVIWSSGEKSRGGTAVLLVAVLLVPFMFVRLADIWSAGG